MQLCDTSIDSITLHIDELKLLTDIEGARQSHSRKSVLIVEIISDGVSGFGEVPILNLPNYSHEWFGGALLLFKELLLPSIMEQGRLNLQSLDWMVGNGSCRFALECALLDLGSKQSGIGIVDHISDVFENDHFDASRPVSFGATTSAMRGWTDTVREIQRLVAMGASRVKLKSDCSSFSNMDLSIVDHSVLDQLQLVLDFNGSLIRSQLVQLRPPSAKNVSIEEPSSGLTLDELGQLATRLGVTCLLDESSASVLSSVGVAGLPAGVGLVLKPFRFGSWIGIIEVIEQCLSCNTPLYLGGMFESSIGRRFLLALGAHSGFNLVGDMVPSGWYYQRDIGPPIVTDSPREVRAQFSNGIDVASLENHLCSSMCFTVSR